MSMTVSSSSKMGTVGDELGVGARKSDEMIGEKAAVGMTASNGSPHVLGSNACGTETRECGICSTAVVDRGVLDCCNDWFCFACIDDWATVTNLCPLCKARFRFITCLPVRQGDGREGDLSAGFAKRVDGPNEDEGRHPFSFPSYFIDEEAVLCLEGDACRVRAGLISQNDEGEIAADTSVACDLCDCWYHAGCVDFDPDQPSFYCPRCRNPPVEANGSLDPSSSWPQVPTDASQSLLGSSLSSGNEVSHGKGSYYGSTCIDEGLSAVPISMHPIPDRSSLLGRPAEPMWSPIRELVKPSYHHAPIPETLGAFQIENQWSPTPGSADHGEKAVEEILWSPTPEAERFSRTASEEQASSSLLFSVKGIGSGSASTIADKEDFARRVSFASGKESDASKGYAITNGQGESGNQASRTSQDFARSVFSNISSVNDSEEVRVDVNRLQSDSEQTRRNKKRIFPEGGMADFKNLPEPPQKVTRTSVKRIEHSGDRQLVDKNDRVFVNTVSPGSAVSHIINDQTNSGKSAITTGEELATSAELTGEEKSSQDLESGTRKRKTPASRTEVDVMDIVGDPLLNPVRKKMDSSKKQDGVRTRIIMHREQKVTDTADSSIVGRIREQMKEGADYMKGEVVEVSDDRFIAAFKAAVARSRSKDTESREAASRQTSSSHALKTQTEGKRSRASLTRKLYAGGTGRWDRDWDISFWKERSARGNASRKEAGGEKSSRVQSTKAESVVEEDSIFSRLYVADNSLFPRKDEMQPMEASRENSAEYPFSDAKGKYSSSAASGSSSSAANATDIVNNSRIAERTTVANGGKERSSLKGSAKPGTPPLQASKSFKLSESTSSATDVRKDKRQWALDVLARKTGITANGAGSAVKPREATNAGGQLNLMVQLPDDMRPFIPHDRHSKVPTAVRQVQLNRIIEQELKFANLGTIRRCPETEEAIHKATAREEEIHQKANSKGVYVNLCVRALAQAEAEEESNKAAALNTLVHIALQATGLIDTPPGSPEDEDVQINTSMNNEAEGMAEEVAGKLTGPQARKAEEFQNSNDLNSNSSLRFNYDGQSEDNGNPEYSGPVSGTHAVPQVENSEVKKNKLTFVLSSVSTKDSEGSEKPKCSTPTDGKLGSGTNVESLTPQADGTGNKSLDDQHAVIHMSAEPSVNNSDEVAHLKTSEIHLEQESLSSNTRQERDALETADDHGKKSMSLDTACDSEGQVQFFSEHKIEEPSKSPSRAEEPITTDWMESGKFADLDRRIEDIRRKTSPSADKDLAVPWSSTRAAGIPEDGDPFNSPFSVQKQVEIFVNQHLKPLYKSGVIKAEQFRYTVSKTAAKVMEYHENAVSADFLIAEGAKVRKLADQYLQAFSKRKIK